MQDPFIKAFDPPVGKAEEIRPGLRRIVAPNASPMTFRGTNTWLLGESEVAVIDPGPDNPLHLAAILEALGGRPVSHILVTHSHVDHSPLARALAARTDAPVCAFGASDAGRRADMVALGATGLIGGGEGVDHAFAPDVTLADGAVLEGAEWRVEAIATPGHFGNHLCFAWEDAVFTGDHVMSWATTMVSPPDGDLTDFMASLEKLRARQGDRVYLPGHGAVLEDPAGMIRHQIAHRRRREAQILGELVAGPADPETLTRRIYTDLDPRLRPAAARNVLAHLIDLHRRGRVATEGALAADALFFLV